MNERRRTRRILMRVMALSAALILAGGCGGESGDSAAPESRERPVSSASTTEQRMTTTTTTTTTMPIEMARAEVEEAAEEACNEAILAGDVRLARLAWDADWTKAGLRVRDYESGIRSCAEEGIARRQEERAAEEARIEAERAAERAAEDARIEAERAAEEARIAAEEAEYQRQYISMDEFMRIRSGMSYRQVVDIVGSEGELSAQSEGGGFVFEMYSWKGSGGGGANAIISFQNGSVASKAQAGL